MEAANAGKALITTKDSGGILGIAKEKITGWVTDQNAKAIAHAMDDATCNRDDTGTRGKAAKQLWESFGISWENTIKRLLL
jgi:glycosyltransferase involved in cell wall biosynthesis